MDKPKIPSIVAIVFLVVGVVTGVFLVQQRQIFKLSASSDFSPEDVRITNISSDSFTVSWYTEKNAIGALYWGEGSNTDSLQLEKNTSPQRIHYIKVEGLSPETKYSFTISSGGDSFSNSGIPWSVKTTPLLQSQTQIQYLSGKVFTGLGTPASEAIVYIQIGGAALISTQTSEQGSWIVSLSQVSNQSLTGVLEVNANTFVNVFVQGGALGVSTAQVYVRDAHPMPDMTLGNSYDFRNANTSSQFTLPEAEINLPEDESYKPKFNLEPLNP